MKHSTAELLDIVYHYYPRGEMPKERHEETEEHRRLVAARIQAGAEREPWLAMLRRMGKQFPENIVQNRSLHLPRGGWDAAYSGAIYLSKPLEEHDHTVGFLVSFVVPYYVIYSTRTVEDTERKPPSGPPKSLTFHHGRTMYVVPNWWWTRLLARAVDAVIQLGERRTQEPIDPIVARARERKKMPPTRRDVHLDLSPEEQPYAAWLAREIEATWGVERMPPEIGKVIVPDVATNLRAPGEARLYDCLFSDNW
jgi:hypothetical protein